MSKNEYSTSAFWEDRYKATANEHYQWYCSPAALMTEFQRLSITKTGMSPLASVSQILELGAGTSNLSIEVIKRVRKEAQNPDLHIHASCIDFSKEVIKHQRIQSTKGNYSSNLNYQLGDIRDMHFLQSNSYDLIVDKGTLDCLFCHDSFMKEVLQAMRECYRLLKENGVMIIASHAPSKLRKYLFRNKLVPFEQVACHTFKKNADQYVRRPPNEQLYHMYVCYKRQKDGGIIGSEEEGEFEQDRNESTDQQQADHPSDPGQGSSESPQRKCNQPSDGELEPQPVDKSDKQQVEPESPTQIIKQPKQPAENIGEDDHQIGLILSKQEGEAADYDYDDPQPT